MGLKEESKAILGVLGDPTHSSLGNRISTLETRLERMQQAIESLAVTETRRKNEYMARIEQLHLAVFELEKQLAFERAQNLKYQPLPEIK